MKRNLTISLEKPLYDAIQRERRGARMSASAWMAVAAEEKLGLRGRLEPARPAEAKSDDKGDAA